MIKIKRTIGKAVFLLSGCMLYFPFMQGAVELPALFTDYMVLQQETVAPFWGKASPGKTVRIKVPWSTEPYTTKADEKGRWRADIQTPAYGGPYSIEISDGESLFLHDVMIGEVWICSGQSNMEMPLAGWGKIRDYLQETAAADYPDLRLFQVEKRMKTLPQPDIRSDKNAGWQKCSPQTVEEFSAVAYFFGRELVRHKNLPVGLIHTSWGGTPAEAWVSAESLEMMPYFSDYVKKLRTVPEEKLAEIYAAQVADWQKKIENMDPGYREHRPKWASCGYADNEWKEMPIPGLWEKSVLPDFDGIVWLRKEVLIPPAWEGKELTLSLGGIDDNDITFFNGKEVGRNEGWDLQRIYKIPGSLVKAGKTVITVRIADMGMAGGFSGSPEQIKLSLNSDEQLPLAGNWKYKTGPIQRDMPARPISPLDNPKCPTTLYNAMLYPLAPYAFQGVIWYQGEANTAMAEQYRTLFPLLINDWRQLWERNFPFYFVQLAAFNPEKDEPGESEWAELREAQLNTLHWENTGMAVTMDIGDATDIHPKNKQDVGYRLSLIARANTYGENIPYSGPLYESYRISGNKIYVRFSHVSGGLKSGNGEKLTGFAIAGPDHRYYWADAVIERDEVAVSSPAVSTPVAVRYGWADNMKCNLYNGAGLPASPFRTDRSY